MTTEVHPSTPDVEKAKSEGVGSFKLLWRTINRMCEQFKDWQNAPKFSNDADEVGGATARMYREYLAWKRNVDEQKGEECGLSFREEDLGREDGTGNFCAQVALRLEYALSGRFGTPQEFGGRQNSIGRVMNKWSIDFVTSGRSKNG